MMKIRNNGIVIILLCVLTMACSNSDDSPSEPKDEVYMSAKVGGVQTDLSFTLEARINIEDGYNLEIIGFIPEEKNDSGVISESIMMVIFDSTEEITVDTYPLNDPTGYKMLIGYNITKENNTQINFNAVTDSSTIDNDAFEITITQIDDKYVSGTFKGVLVGGTPENAEALEITDGEFKAPVRQSN